MSLSRKNTFKKFYKPLMNARYGKANFDVAMKLGDKSKALNFGRKQLSVKIYK